MQEIKDLTLAGIDGMRHLTTSEAIVRAVAFAVRHADSFRRDIIVNRTAYRFVVAVAAVGALENESQWLRILDHIQNMEVVERGARRLADTRPLLDLGDGAWYDDNRGTVRTVLHGSREYVIRWPGGKETYESASDILSDAEHAAVDE